jgi:hypothetical protein
MSSLLANAGIPMIFWQLPAAAVIFLPVVLAESLIALPILKQPFVPIFLRVGAANALSTFVGLPVAWIGMVIVNIATTGGRAHAFETPWGAFQSIVLQASWLVPHEGQMLWLIPAATLVLLVPYFLTSVIVERWLMRRLFSHVDQGKIRRVAWAANGVTYSGLAAYTAYWLMRALAGGTVAA